MELGWCRMIFLLGGCVIMVCIHTDSVAHAFRNKDSHSMEFFVLHVRGRRLTMQVWKRIGDGKPVLNMPRTPCITTVDSNKTVL